ncbi:MAG: DMT family transporter [Rickettsiales bacterium]|nr:DMT family transporter [Rickettsiales bacterium]
MGRISWLFGLITIDATIAATVTYLRPIFAILIAIFFLNEKITFRIISGLLISVLGTSFVIIPVMTEFNITSALAIMAITFSPLAWALYDVVVKTQSKDHWEKQTYLNFLLISILTCPFTFIDWKPLDTHIISVIILIGFLYIIMEITLASALQRIPLVLAAPIDFVRVVFTAILAYIFLGETITLTTSIGCILIITAILVIFLKTPRKKENQLNVEEPT